MRSRVINERLFHIVQIVRFRLPEVVGCNKKKIDQIEKNGRQKKNTRKFRRSRKRAVIYNYTFVEKKIICGFINGINCGQVYLNSSIPKSKLVTFAIIFEVVNHKN